MNRVLLSIAVILVCAVFGYGQKDGEGAQTEKSGKQTILTSGTMIDAQLESTLDAKNAKVGDRVALKTTKSIKQGGEVIIPKGSTLIGWITDVQRRTKQNTTSRLGMIFDRIEGKNLSAPITASIVSITNATTRVPADNVFATDLSTSSQSSASASRAGSSSGAGLLGGVTNTAGGLLSTTTQTASTVTGTAGSMAAGTTQVVGQTLNGIQISTVASGTVGSSTTLSSPTRDVRIQKGATFSLRVAANGSLQEY